MMLAELRLVLESVPAGAPRAAYRSAIVEENALGKRTSSTRKLSAQRLSELYGLDPSIPLFRVFRRLWEPAGDGRPLLAFLLASARDPLLRMTAPGVLRVRPGDVVATRNLELAIAEAAPQRFNDSTRAKIARNAASSWTQSGHLAGRVVKRRTHPLVTAEAVVYALLLSHLCGLRGQLLISSFWPSLLDAPGDQLLALATAASQRGLFDFKRIGTVMEARFGGLLTPVEEEQLCESA